MPKVPYQSDGDMVWRVLNEVHGNLAFDIGANGGLVSRALAERFETVIACEPAIESYSELVGDVPHNVRTLNIAVSDVTGPIQLREATVTQTMGELVTGELLSPWGDHIGYRTVDAITLDDLSAEYGFPDFVKIDTEGHEIQIVEGGLETFAKNPRFIIEVHRREFTSRLLHIFTELDVPYSFMHHHLYKTEGQKAEHYWLCSANERFQ